MHLSAKLTLGLIAIGGAVSALSAAGCGTTNNLNTGGGTSALGESCTRTFDCANGLVCVANVCYQATTASTSDAGPGDGGSDGATGPHLGLLGESCQITADCESSLACVGGSCRPTSTGATATGKSCVECQAATDCCELPADLDPSLEAWCAPVTTYIDSGYYAGTTELECPVGAVGHAALEALSPRCQDLLDYMGGNTSLCSSATLPAAGVDSVTYGYVYAETGLAKACSLYMAYCECSTSTWACTNNTCVYTAPCGVGTTTVTTTTASTAQCAPETRTGTPLSTTCTVPDGGTTGTCGAAAGQCSTSSDCVGQTGIGTSAKCAETDAGDNDCTCYMSGCYFTCKSDLDCAGGYTCNTTKSLCQVAPACTTNDDCIVKYIGSAYASQYQCVMGACVQSCTEDIQCGADSVCSSGACVSVLGGCTTNADCSGSVQEFCVTTPTTTATTTYTSAVTNGGANP
jgi:hypothetical protein